MGLFWGMHWAFEAAVFFAAGRGHEADQELLRYTVGTQVVVGCVVVESRVLSSDLQASRRLAEKCCSSCLSAFVGNFGLFIWTIVCDELS